jgi:hypothetical protein
MIKLRSSEIITRAIDTVHAAVTLTDVIAPQAVKPVGVFSEGG